MNKFLCCVAALILTSFSIQAQDTTNIRASRIKDGDTFEAIYQNTPTAFRIECIDAPESTQLYGRESKQYLESLILNQDLFVIVGRKDKYGRYIVSLPDVVTSMLESGYAWAYLDYCKNKEFRQKVKDLEQVAKEQKIGLWNYKPIEPAKYRKMTKQQKVKYQ